MQNQCFKVCVQCFTYNHVNFIENTMNGFCMQQTSFPFICMIVDDASTDGEPEVIRKYVENNFDLTEKSVIRNEDTDDYKMTFARHKENKNCYFVVYYLKYNHCSIRKPKYPYLSEWLDNATYLALCEGDDYWIEETKLQKQSSYMDDHPDCTMTCNRTKLYSEKKKKYTGEQYCRNSDGILNPVDIINRTGIYIPTCSIMYRPEIKKKYPDYCKYGRVGDYPLQITAAMKGRVYYFDKCMSVYRRANSASWMGQQQRETLNPIRLKVVCGQKNMFEGFANDYPAYKMVLKDKIFEHILRNMPKPIGENKENMQTYQNFFPEEFSNLTLKWKIYYIFCKSRIPGIKELYHNTILRKYRPKYVFYDKLNFLYRFYDKITK